MIVGGLYFDISSRRIVVLIVVLLTVFTMLVANIVYLRVLQWIYLGVDSVRLDDPLIPFLISFITFVLALPIFAGFLTLTHRNAALQERLKEIIRRDQLTGAMSREAFLQDFAALHTEEGRAHPGALLVVDADHFKNINDTWGHEVGDRALVGIARALQAGIGAEDFLGRIGGEEFAIFLSDVSIEKTRQIAERLRAGVEAMWVNVGAERVPVSVSIGGVHLPTPQTFKSAFSVADRLLYDAKHNGRNRVEIEAAPVRRPVRSSGSDAGAIFGGAIPQN